MPAVVEDNDICGAITASAPVSIVHLVHTLHLGGLEKVVYDLVRCTDREAFSLRVICLGEIGALGSQVEACGVPVETLDVYDKGPLAGIRALSRRLRALRPDVLHTHNSIPHLVGAPAARLCGVPAVVHTRHGRHLFRGWKTGLVNRLACRWTQRMVAVSEDAARIARKHDRVPESKLLVVWNGIDLRDYPKRDRQASSAPRPAMHVARLNDDIKDQSTLLRAARLVADKRPDFRLDIVGDGPDRGALEALSNELKLAAHVRFLGYRLDVNDMLAEGGMFVLSSLTEGLSISLLEAMAAGLPVVATDVGGNPEVVANGVTGLLVPARTPEALAAAMLKLLQDPARAEQMGAAGRRRVEEHFDLQKVARKYEQIYRCLLR